MPAIYGWAVVVLALVGFAVWLHWAIRRGASAEAQAEKETRARLASEKARERELEIRDAVRKVHDQPGPAVPDLGGVRGGAHRQDPPA